MLIYLYSKNLGFRGGGSKSSLITIKYLNLSGHKCLSFSNINVLKKAVKNKKPDLILHHNILNMYQVLRLSKKHKIPLIITVNGLITCGRGFNYKPNKSGFGKKCFKCSISGVLKCSILKEKGFKNSIINKIKLILSIPIRFLKIKLRIYCLNRTDGIIAVGSTLKETLIENGVINKIYVCPQPIDDDFLKIQKKIIKSHVKEFNRNEKVISYFNKSKKKRIILAGGFFVEKGALVCLKAFSKLNRNDTEVFVIGRIYPYVNMNTYKPFIGKNVYFTGKVSLDEMKNFYKKATFLAFPVIWLEPYGRVWAEALMHKCPILSLKGRAGANDYLIHNKEAYFCEPNLESLKKGISKLLDDKKLRNELARDGYKYSKRNLTASIVVKKLERIYKKVIKKN